MDTCTCIRQTTVAEVRSAPNIDQLLAEYEAESSQIGAACAQWDTYEALERAGTITVLGAFQGDHLVGFLVLLVAVLPHYGRPVGTTESFFVSASARHHGTWKRLIRNAEGLAIINGADDLLISAPAGSALERALPLIGYRHTNTVMARKLS